jgi:hypothetical protein
MRVNDGPPVAEPPNFIEYRVASDGSIVCCTYRFWEDGRKSRVTVHLNQTWPDGLIYREKPYVADISDFRRLPLATPEQVQSLRSYDANA